MLRVIYCVAWKGEKRCALIVSALGFRSRAEGFGSRGEGLSPPAGFSISGCQEMLLKADEFLGVR